MAAAVPEGLQEEYLQAFDSKLKENTVQPKPRPDWVSQAFVLSTKLIEWLNTPAEKSQDYINVEILLDDVYKDHPDLHPPKKIIDLTSGQKRCLLTFCILLELRLGHLLHCFLRCGIHDTRLPMPLNNLVENITFAMDHPPLLKSEYTPAALATDFNQRQWKYFPAKFAYRDENDWSRPRVFPFVDRQLITGKGGTAEVFEVAIPEAFVDKDLMKFSPTKLPHPDFPKIGPVYRFALKVFKDGHKSLWEQEISAYKTLGDKKGMVQYLGNFSHVPYLDRSTHNILLEYADNDLGEYFHLSSPILPKHINAFWDRLLRIVFAIKEFHNFEVKRLRKSKSMKVKGWHADIKPDNILLVGEEFKLADPGFAKFQRLQDNMKSQSDGDETQGGTTTYAAPELFSRDAHDIDHAKSDMWSLACVLSEAATWMVLGYTGTRQYSHLRREAIRKLPTQRRGSDQAQYRAVYGGDCFHNGVAVLPEILEWHTFLRTMVRPTDEITRLVLDMIDTKLFKPEVKQRSDAEKLSNWCNELHKSPRNENCLKVPPNIESTLEQALEEEVDELSRTFQSLGMEDVERRKQVKSSTSFLQVLSLGRPSSPGIGRRNSSHGANQGEDVSQSQAGNVMQRARTSSSNQSPSYSHPSRQATRSFSLSSDLDATRETVFDSHYRHQAEDEGRSTFHKWFGYPSYKDSRLARAIVNRDLLFLVDNAESMHEHWSEVMFVLENLVQCTWNIDPDGVELRFTNGPHKVQCKKQRDHDLLEIKKAMRHSDAIPEKLTTTNMGANLDKILFHWLRSFKSALENRQEPKELTIIVLTDGRWEAMSSNRFAVDKLIVKFHKQLNTAADGWQLNRPVSIQFISFGNDPDALYRLKRLDNELIVEGVPDIVDTEPSTGDVYQMLLGSISDEYDNRNDYEIKEAGPPSEFSDPFDSPPLSAVSTNGSNQRQSLGHRNSSVSSQDFRKQASATSENLLDSMVAASTPTPKVKTTQH